MSYDLADTIAAIASATGGAARAIIRVSGPRATDCVARCFAADSGAELLTVRRARRLPGKLQLGPPLGLAPCDLYLWTAPHSYTREPCVELHTIGAAPIASAALAAVCRCGARPAEPGEFTLRAFLAGRLDLTQAEAVLGVIDAHSRQELNVALAQLAGGLQRPLSALREQLLDLLSHLEAGLDFVEEDIEFITADDLAQSLGGIAQALEELLAQMQSRGAASDEYRVVLCGPPNAGKSSLLNALAQEEAAIVSEVAGTTRDYVTRRVEIGGLPCRVFDTAGIIADFEERVSPEAAAQRQSQEVLAQAQVVVRCSEHADVTAAPDPHPGPLPRGEGGCTLFVLTKADLKRPAQTPPGWIATSSHSGQGLPELRQAIAAKLQALGANQSQFVAGTAARCGESLRRAELAIRRAREVAQNGRAEELVAAELRQALDELGTVVGAVYTDDILDRIFSRFCIGK